MLEVLHDALLYAHHHQLERTKSRPYLVKMLDVHTCMVLWLKEVVDRYCRRYLREDSIELYVDEHT